jgi:hypothetical protein
VGITTSPKGKFNILGLLLTCPLKNDPTFMAGIGKRDTVKFLEKATPLNKVSVGCGKR